MNQQDFFKVLPSEIMVDIISRLPIRTILICKCICNSWRNLLESDYFVQYHLSKSVSGLALQTYGSQWYRIYESVDWKHHTPLQWFKFDEPFACAQWDQPTFQRIVGSVDGLLFIRHYENVNFPTINIVNPTTHEYIKIECSRSFGWVTGLGVSKKTCQYKIISISSEDMKSGKCEVYTLGTGSWRSISIPAHVRHLKYFPFLYGAFVNGNLHWLAYDLNYRVWICCFNLEYEHFSIFASPLPLWHWGCKMPRLSALDNCLWLFDISCDNEFVIWVLKDYADEKSWTKKFVIQNFCHSFLGDYFPIMISEDGDSLVVSTTHSTFHYSRKRDVVDIYVKQGTMAIHHKCSLLSLKRFAHEKVRSLTNETSLFSLMS